MTDPYEQQLLAVFESCDVGGTGKLDCEGLSQLCDQLHLEEGRRQLMDCLLPAFTFDQFRDALLTLLGASRRHSDINREPSPDREVSPKFVFGQKKYGRRSRPESQEDNEEEAEESEEEVDAVPLSPQDEDVKSKKTSSPLISDCEPGRVSAVTPTSVVLEKEEIESPRGQGEAELRKAWRRLGVGTDGYLDTSELAMVCRAVGMEKMADEVVNQVFAKLDQDSEGRISFEEFLQLFQGNHNQLPDHSPPSFVQQSQLTSLDITSSGYVSSDSLVDLWEAGGVVNAPTLLQDLGLVSCGEVNVGAVAAILDEEVRSMASKSSSVSPSPQVTALTAALVLAQAQLKWTRSCLEQMSGERDKLHSDLTEANQRATLLAQEVDDRHARMERASQMQIKLLEQRHAEQVRQLGVQLAVDRDHLTAATLRLEKRLAAQQQEETKLRSELQKTQAECELMEKENQNLSEQLEACEVVKNKAEKDSLQIQQLNQRVQELESCSDQVQSLVEQLARLQTENTCLRDRNDELTLQLENLTSRPICKRQNSSDSGAGGGTKRRGHSPLALAPEHSWDEESPRLGKVRRYCTDTDLSLDSVPMEGLAIGRTLRHSESGLEADLDTLDNSLTLSSPSGEKDNFNIGSREEAYLKEIDLLRASIAELQQANEEYRKKQAEINFNPKDSPDSIKSSDISMMKAVTMRQKFPEDEEGSGSYATTLATETTEVQTSLETTTDVNRLEKHCYELRHTLENVQAEIVKILSEKKACCEENCVLKQRIEELSKRLPKSLNDDTHNTDISSGPLTYTVTNVPINSLEISKFEPVCCDNVKDSPKNVALKCFPFMNRKQSNSDSPYCLFPTKDKKDNGTFKFENLSQFAFELSQSLSDTNLIIDPFSELESKPLSPCLSDIECVSVNRKLDFTCNDTKSDSSSVVINNVEQQTSPVQDNETIKLAKEIGELKEKCTELETSLELMRVEYEKCEDYWQGKLNEERAIFDQEQKLSDEKFVELEAKIQEYAELFNEDDKKMCGRLPTIDERDSLEKQVTDLEEEFEEYKNMAEKEAQAKIVQIENLQIEFDLYKKKQKEKEENVQEVGVQVSEQPSTFRLHETRTTPETKLCLGVAEVDCCCPCHGHMISRKGLTRLRDSRTRLQAECDLLQRRREILLHQLSQIHQRTNLLFSPMPDRRLASDIEMFHNLSSRLRHQELRCRHLQSALKHHQRQTDKLLQNAWEQHKSDLSSVQKTLHITQEKLLHQTKLCKQQMERLATSDVLVKNLYKENAQLSALVQKLEEQNLFVDQSILASTV